MMCLHTECDPNPYRCDGTVAGECRKADAHSLLAAHREAVVRRAQRALLAALLVRGSATADDVRELVDLPPGIDPKCFGGAPGALARAGIIRRDGFVRTVRPEGHARPVTIWSLVDRRKAIEWLRDHPAPPDPPPERSGQPGTLFD